MADPWASLGVSQPSMADRLMNETIIPSQHPPQLSPAMMAGLGSPNPILEQAMPDRNTSFVDKVWPQPSVGQGVEFAANILGVPGLRGIRAYHGSPHKFDRFDMSKIGTGEGAQAYGHGLYFAENPGTAKYYRDVLAENQGTPVQQLMQMGMVDRAGGKERTQAEAVAFLSKIADDLRGVPPPRSYTPRFTADDYAEAAQRLAAGERSGHMYEVNIRANPEQFLDWDRPLSQQSELVRGAIGRRMPAGKDVTGPNIYGLLRRPTGVDSEASASLRDAGIPGIKYLDQGSRGAGEGSRNYVVFDDSIVDILKRYGIAAPVAAWGAFPSTSEAAN